MNKKFTLLTVAVALFAASASADNLVIQTNEKSGVEIIQNAKFNKVSNYIGNTNADTQICLGEVDFGADGNNYKAAGIVFANGWNVDGWAILHAGSDFESSVPFTQIAINETGGYDNFYTYASNMSYDAASADELAGGSLAVDGVTYTKPTGKQKVYLTFVGGAGNIRSVVLYDKALTEADMLMNENSYDYKIRLLEPNEKADYAENSIILMTANSTRYAGFDPDSDEPKFDTNWDPVQWGWTKDGFVASYGEADFGDGGYKQVMVRFTHYSENINDYINVYLDEVKPENRIAHIWSGRNLDNKAVASFAKNITTNITGKHLILVEWEGGSTNLEQVNFCKGTPWLEATDCGVIIEDVEPSESAFHFTFVDCPDGEGNPWGYEVKANGNWESAGNIGYTKNGTVINFYGDGEGVDFGDGKYKRIIVNHSCEKTWVGEIDESNFSFYLDIDPDQTYSLDDWKDNLATILDGKEPIAKVRLQGTGSWGSRKKTAGKIVKEVSGKHELYMVYNTPGNDIGANVFDIYLDPVEGSSSTPVIGAAKGVEVYTAAGEIIVSAENDATIRVYSVNGANVLSQNVKAGEYNFNVASGFYLVTATTAEGVSAYKVIVK